MRKITTLVFAICCFTALFGQDKPMDLWDSGNFQGLEFRSIGPAFMSGRIADIAINPNDESEWYVAVGSGGVWKTENAGTTWTPIFDNEACYATGCITIDPNNDQVIWLGTGENVGGRHMSFGCGIYKSEDGGISWMNMGLEQSEHISKIVVHPTNPNVLWVASQGPLWSKGGERGVFKTIDGGKNWKQVLGDKAWTGATELAIDPRNPDQLYAVTWDRHRTVAAYMGGGPGTGIHSSVDGGETWKELTKGLPESNMGKIGFAISPQQPDILYAAIEEDRRKGGVYKSTDKGNSWEKMSEAVSGGTGPHYYQELYACPHNFDRLYLMDVRVQISDNGGKNFRRMTEKHKHSDNHALAFKASDPDYLLMGTDGGMYESFDLAAHWKFFSNLPLTQFYKIAVDDAEPFYNVYGGTQDNSTEGGPSRTDNIQGIENGEWKVVLNWDGHQPATEPGNPYIMYGQRQQGTLARIDLKTGEVVDVQPQPGKGEVFERYNWDAPILVSPHDPKQLFFASQRLWRSNDRGDSWTALSGDLTRNENRLALPIMGKKQSFDNPWDVFAMSNYNTITSIAESPVKRDLIYIGTDDGRIQITEDGGANWQKIEASSLPGVPARAYVNDIKADLFDENVVYITLDNHKEGDYRPFVFKSINKGKSWQSIGSGLPSKTLVWRIVQDHVKKDLMFLATEFGIYFTHNGGNKWTQLKGGLPVISFRDLTIHRRESDLIAGSFGRSIYIFDDMSVFRGIGDKQMKEEATLFTPRKAWWYIPRSSIGFGGQKGDQGAEYFVADNPDFGASISYYLKDGYKTESAMRKEKEKEATKNNSGIEFPGWDVLDKEENEKETLVWLTIKDSEGKVVRRMKAPSSKGFHRVAWDLRYPAPNMVELNPTPRGEWDDAPTGFLAAPGSYSVSLSKQTGSEVVSLSEEHTFEVMPLQSGSLPGATQKELTSFFKEYDATVKKAERIGMQLSTAQDKASAIERAIINTPASPGTFNEGMNQLKSSLVKMTTSMYGSPAKNQVGEKTHPTIGNRLFAVSRVISQSTYGPTQTSKDVLNIVNEELKGYESGLAEISTLLKSLAKKIIDSGGPFIEGMD